MSNLPPKLSFWIGNGLLAVALLMLFVMNPLATQIGTAAFIIWAVLVAAGMYLVLKDRTQEPPPD